MNLTTKAEDFQSYIFLKESLISVLSSRASHNYKLEHFLQNKYYQQVGPVNFEKIKYDRVCLELGPRVAL